MASHLRPVVRQNSRAGCKKCKERRVKCDLRSPSCENCVRGRIQCPGYGKTYSWKEKHQICLQNQHDTAGDIRGPRQRQHGLLPQMTNIDNSNAPRDKNKDFEFVSACCNSPKRSSIRDSHAVISRLSTEGVYFPMLRPPLPTQNETETLIWHYFHSVCVFYSCAAAQTDPLRTVTRDLMSSSRLIYFCILSMSAAHLHQLCPQRSIQSLEYHIEALSTLRTQLVDVSEETSSTSFGSCLHQTLLGVILLGMSTSWHGTAGLGLEHVAGSRILFKRYFQSKQHSRHALDQHWLRFYLGLQAYWEAVSSFLLDQELEELEYLDEACSAIPSDTSFIHPWTGISSTVWALLTKAGCISRRYSRLLANQSGDPDGEKTTGNAMERLERQARTVATQLLSYQVPLASAVGPYDGHSLPLHMECMAHCCKLAGLLELWQAFGSVWSEQLTLDTVLAMEESFLPGISNRCRILRPPTGTDVRAILSALSLSLVQTLRSIPEDSTTRFAQSVLLLVAGSALSPQTFGQTRSGRGHGFECMQHSRAPEPESAPSSVVADWAITSQCYSADSPDSLDGWRQFICDRLIRLEQDINLDSIRNVRTILHEVWSCRDELQRTGSSSEKAVSWINIMEEKNLWVVF